MRLIISDSSRVAVGQHPTTVLRERRLLEQSDQFLRTLRAHEATIVQAVSDIWEARGKIREHSLSPVECDHPHKAYLDTAKVETLQRIADHIARLRAGGLVPDNLAPLPDDET